MRIVWIYSEVHAAGDFLVAPGCPKGFPIIDIGARDDLDTDNMCLCKGTYKYSKQREAHVSAQGEDHVSSSIEPDQNANTLACCDNWKGRKGPSFFGMVFNYPLTKLSTYPIPQGSVDTKPAEACTSGSSSFCRPVLS